MVASVPASRMCRLYSLCCDPEALGETFSVAAGAVRGLLPLSAVLPDQIAPVIRNGPGERELALLRWGLPPPIPVPGRPLAMMVRNAALGFWRPWMGVGHRCLVPATNFAQQTPLLLSGPNWFALSEARPLFAFAGIWRPWTGNRGNQEGKHDVFALLAAISDAASGQARPSPMPVLLTTDEDYETWLTAPLAKALGILRPAPDKRMPSVATCSSFN